MLAGHGPCAPLFLARLFSRFTRFFFLVFFFARPPRRRDDARTRKMTHANVYFSHPREYGRGSREWYVHRQRACRNAPHAPRMAALFSLFFFAAATTPPDGRRRCAKETGRAGPGRACRDAGCAVLCRWMRMVALLSCDALVVVAFLPPTLCWERRGVCRGAACAPSCRRGVACVGRARILLRWRRKRLRRITAFLSFCLARLILCVNPALFPRALNGMPSALQPPVRQPQGSDPQVRPEPVPPVLPPVRGRHWLRQVPVKGGTLECRLERKSVQKTVKMGGA